MKFLIAIAVALLLAAPTFATPKERDGRFAPPTRGLGGTGSGCGNSAVTARVEGIELAMPKEHDGRYGPSARVSGGGEHCGNREGVQRGACIGRVECVRGDAGVRCDN